MPSKERRRFSRRRSNNDDDDVMVVGPGEDKGGGSDKQLLSLDNRTVFVNLDNICFISPGILLQQRFAASPSTAAEVLGLLPPSPSLSPFFAV